MTVKIVFIMDAQYTLTLTPITEKRYDSDGDPYDWHVLKVTLTYDTAGASLVGIVVDPEQKIMIHCGNPIQYASYDTRYWKSHFYCYGRIR